MTRPLLALLAATLFAAKLAGAAAAPKPPVHPRPYGRGAAFYHPTEAAPYRFRNEIIDVVLDYPRDLVRGTTTNVIVPKMGGLRTLPFDSVGLRYQSVRVNGIPEAFHTTAGRLYVDLRAPAAAGRPLAVVARYTTHPQRGIYFIHPDRAYPGMHPEIWSQGEMEDNRRWFPTWDEPNEKSPSQLIVTVPSGWSVIANGTLRRRTLHGSSATWAWSEPHPHSTYLTAFSAGPYVTLSDAMGTLPVHYHVSPADAHWGRQCFGRTPQMIAFFQSKIGVPFPWEKYDQTTVERFTAGGMENASATTQTENAIHDPRLEVESSCDDLISHELAHQWWGDDVTTPDWANIWINEGFATYFQELWTQHHFGEAQFQYERYHAQDAYFNETRRYYRPIVDYVYGQAGDSFDASGYQRPGQVLHMLRYVLGEDAFWKALRDYLLAYQYKNADTRQFEAAIEKSTGQNLKWFFDEWFYRAAFPDFTVVQTFDPATHALALDITQKNHDRLPFQMPVVIQVYTDQGVKSTRVNVEGTHQIATISGVESVPNMVLFDPNDTLIRKLHFHKSITELHYQATHAPAVGDRLWAVEQLSNAGKTERQAAREAIRDVVAHDPFYGVRVDALDAATNLADQQSVAIALHDPDPRVVIAAANASADLEHAGTALLDTLRGLSRSTNPQIAGAALHGLGASKRRWVYPLLVDGLGRTSFREWIARGADSGLAAFGDLRAAPLLERRAAYGSNESERPDAIAALGRLAKKHPERVRVFLSGVARHDPFFRARRAAVSALARLRDRGALGALEAVEKNDPEPGVRNAAWDAIADIRDAAKGRGSRRGP